MQLQRGDLQGVSTRVVSRSGRFRSFLMVTTRNSSKGRHLKRATENEALLGHSRPSPEVWKEIFAHLPMLWRAMCCRVCKVWQKDFEQPHQGHGDDVLVDYGLATLCSVLATRGVDEVMRRIRLHCPSGIIPKDLGRMDQVRRFVQCHRFARIESVDEWMQLASQEPDAGWLCKGASRTSLEGMGKGLMRQVVGKPQEFSKLLGSVRGHIREVVCVAYSPDGKHIASASHDRTVRIWDTETEQEVHTLTWHTDNVHSVAWSPDGEMIASGSRDETVCLGSKSGKLMHILKGHSGDVQSVVWSPDGEMIASGGYDRTVRLWSKSGKHKGTLKEHPSSVSLVAWSPDGEMIASGCNGTLDHDHTIRLWSMKKGVFERFKGWVKGKDPRLLGTLKGHSGGVTSVAYWPDGKHIIDTASFDKTFKIWDAETKQEECTLNGLNLKGHSGSVKRGADCVAYSPDGKRIASASNCDVEIWDAETNQEVCSLGGHDASWQHLDPEMKALAAKVKSGESAGSNRTGQYIVTANRDMVYVYGTESEGEHQGEPLACFRSPAIVSAVSCKGTSVFVGCEDGQVSRFLPPGANAAVL